MAPVPASQQAVQAKGSMNGVLSIPASATQKSTNTGSQRNVSTKGTAPRLKLILRRLPPGLTQTEFDAALGDDWKAGGGKVDWFLYKEGKVSKDPSKPSRPSRAYFRVTAQPQISLLSDAVRQTAFQDARNTSKDSVLLGPPSLEFAPYGRVPGSRLRKDARQGTIDQDPEFIDFLESLTNPITKASAAEESDGAEKKEEKTTTTPLIQFLKDKKANKGKEAAIAAKASKHARQDSKDAKAEKFATQNKKLLNRPEKDSAPDRKGRKESKVDKAAKEAVKVLNKQAATSNAKASEKLPAQAPVKEPSATPPVERKRERGSARGVAAILQRDLGITPPGGARRRQKPTLPEAGKAAPAITTPTQPSQPDSDKVPIAPKSSTQVPPSPKPAPTKPPNTEPPTGPAASRHVPKQNPAAPSPKQPKATPVPAPIPLPTGTQAFLKHANPSQGITEPLLEEAFSAFGKLTKVEIDKRKGFGYIDFADSEGLHKALQANPVKIAQGSVQVLERKTGPTLAARNVRGGGNNVLARGGQMGPPQATPPVPVAGRGAPQGPAMRPPHGPRGGRGRGAHRGGMGRGGGHGNTNVPPGPTAGIPASSSPGPNAAAAPSAPASAPVSES